MGASCLALTTPSVRAGRAGVARGKLNEQRALKAAQRLPTWWFLSARATKPGGAEDRLGVDLVVETVHRGSIRLQVKSSAAYARKFERHGRKLDLRWRIHTVVVTPEMTPEEVLGVVMGTCILAIEEAEVAGLTADDARLCHPNSAPRTRSAERARGAAHP